MKMKVKADAMTFGSCYFNDDDMKASRGKIIEVEPQINGGYAYVGNSVQGRERFWAKEWLTEVTAGLTKLTNNFRRIDKAVVLLERGNTAYYQDTDAFVELKVFDSQVPKRIPFSEITRDDHIYAADKTEDILGVIKRGNCLNSSKYRYFLNYGDCVEKFKKLIADGNRVGFSGKLNSRPNAKYNLRLDAGRLYFYDTKGERICDLSNTSWPWDTFGEIMYGSNEYEFFSWLLT